MTAKEREKMWASRVEAFKKSGKKQTEWCKANGIPKRSLYKWMKRLTIQEAVVASTQNRFILAKTRSSMPSGSTISIRIGNAVINIESKFDTDELTRVVRIVSSIC